MKLFSWSLFGNLYLLPNELKNEIGGRVKGLHYFNLYDDNWRNVEVNYIEAVANDVRNNEANLVLNKITSFYFIKFYIEYLAMRNLRMLVGTALSFVQLLVIWRITKSIQIIKNFMNNQNLKLLVVSIALNLVEGVLEILSVIALAINYTNPFNFFALKKMREFFNKIENKQKFAYLSNLVFINKTYDLGVTPFTILNALCLNFWLLVYRQGKNMSFFPLLWENDQFYDSLVLKNINNQENSKVGLKCILDGFFDRRKRAIKMIIKMLIMSVINLLNLVALLLDPFVTFNVIRDYYCYVKTVVTLKTAHFNDITKSHKEYKA